VSEKGATEPEAALVQVRKEKAERVRARGDNPFANDIAGPDAAGLVRTDLGAVREHFAHLRGEDGRYPADRVPPDRFRVTGRVLFHRDMGQLGFLRLRDQTGELQLYCEEKVLGADGYARLRDDIDLGDFVEAIGTAMATKRGELSIQAEHVRLLTKAYRPLPTKTSFKDIEARYRMRYVDLVANPEVADVFRARGAIVGALRRFFDDRAFLEVETPSMVTLVGGAVARPFETHHNALDMKLFMRIAPELYLKRLIVGGLERVYEIGRCYRNEGLSTRHNPEFTMLEYYQAYATYEMLMDQTEEMLRFVDAELASKLPEAHARWRESRPFTFSEFARVPMKDAIARALELAGLPGDVPQRIHLEGANVKEWAAQAKKAGRDIDWSAYRAGAKKCSSDGERVFAAYEYLAEPFLVRDYCKEEKSQPVFVVDYPFEVSPLARRKDADPSLVDRFELFVNGQELCNAFSELNDPEDQAARFRAQVEAKERGADETMDYDHDYIRALEHGMPPTAGFGMGVDRLTIMLTGSGSIRDVILFPLMRPEGE
jgi:lysyl-tRNA synthetase, class II